MDTILGQIAKIVHIMNRDHVRKSGIICKNYGKYGDVGGDGRDGRDGKNGRDGGYGRDGRDGRDRGYGEAEESGYGWLELSDFWMDFRFNLKLQCMFLEH